MSKKIITNIYEEVKSFYDENILFKTLQVQKSSGIYGKIKKEYIAKYPTRYKGIQINSSDYTNALCFDCDHEDVMLYEDFNLPKPTITTINQKNGKHHHIYYLDRPIPRVYAKPVTMNYLTDVYDGLNHYLKSDLNYTNTITKNFLNQKEFRIICSLNKYKLEDFREYTLNLKNQKAEIETTCFSRHIKLFDEIRYFGYNIAKKCSDEYQLYVNILNYAEKINDGFEEQIKVKYIVKNVSDFCWLHRDNFSDNNWNWDGYKKNSKEETNKSHKQRWKKYRDEKRDKAKQSLLHKLFMT